MEHRSVVQRPQCAPSPAAEKRAVRRCVLTAAVLVGLVGHTSAHAACTTVTTAWQNAAVTNSADVFTLSFDAIPGITGSDGVIGLSKGAATGYPQLAAAVRFNNA